MVVTQRITSQPNRHCSLVMVSLRGEHAPEKIGGLRDRRAGGRRVSNDICNSPLNVVRVSYLSTMTGGTMRDHGRSAPCTGSRLSIAYPLVSASRWKRECQDGK